MGRDPGLRSTSHAGLGVFLLLLVFAMVAPCAARGEEPRVDAEGRRTIDGALRWLASKQYPDGHWGERQHKAAYTAYVVMAFLAGGQLPDEGPNGAAVTRGVKYLLDCVRADGYVVAADEVNDDKGMYGHGIATIALAEACGQTGGAGTEDARAKLKRAVQLIINTQNPQGGWRYFPRVADADLSVTVLQVVALRAAKNDGIDVPQQTIDRAVGYVRSCRTRDASGGFAYQPGGGPGFARTAAAIYSLQVCGLYDDPMVRAGSDYLFQQQTGPAPLHYFTYGNFYAAPAEYMIGGDSWSKWYADVRGRLMGRVRSEGDLCYWPTLDGDGSGFSSIYVTAVDTLILALPDGAVPLYQR